ncbi:hypothetical protein [Microbispora hainanensis]|uniref:Uncharacterized protein n=1 Tax=Microbispora hainanensis TaxID=568844 RepID=A0ABZ1SZC0_9ACTN|nr:hypothetical protein [Microbispora hainanensis]
MAGKSSSRRFSACPTIPGQRLIVSAAKAGTPSADRLALLGARAAG